MMLDSILNLAGIRPRTIEGSDASMERNNSQQTKADVQKSAEPAYVLDISNTYETLSDSQEQLRLLPAPDKKWDVRNMTPRELSEFSYELYIEGVLDQEDYKLLGFPSEMHPDFDSTIGALTGEKAEPDKPLDIVSEWEKKLDFLRKHEPETPQEAFDNSIIERTERIVNVLRMHDAPRITIDI